MRHFLIFWQSKLFRNYKNFTKKLFAYFKWKNKVVAKAYNFIFKNIRKDLEM